MYQVNRLKSSLLYIDLYVLIRKLNSKEVLFKVRIPRLLRSSYFPSKRSIKKMLSSRTFMISVEDRVLTPSRNFILFW